VHKTGLEDYCMGGELPFHTAASVPDRIAMARSHGSNELVVNTSESVHLLTPRRNATPLVFQAKSDDAQEPRMKNAPKPAFTAASRPATAEAYTAYPGWRVQDRPTHHVAQAKRVRTVLMQIYATAPA
jgi:carboxymethylenebutenolidase